ncbi:hypothetical protein [Bacillus swezeyi]|uniref:hypothetical protein n=1 Tax=Bacillus swezeyi TaxID=1925020 RepID=UPI00399CA55D
MTKTNEKIHVLADESLGGIKREYVEVDRKAEVGDKIIVTKSDDFPVGHIDTVAHWYDNYDDGSIDLSEGVDNDVFLDGAREEYCVLEPTNIVHVDGERYEMVDRKAEVGERFIYLDDTGVDLTIGGIYTLYEIIEGVYGFIDDMGDDRALRDEAKYRVLVPVESSEEEEEPQPSDPIDVIANLATRVAELERKVSGFETTIERHECVNDRHKDEIDTLHKDSRRHGEELEALKYAAKETDGKVAHLEADSDMRMFTFKEVSLLLNAMRERR